MVDINFSFLIGAVVIGAIVYEVAIKHPANIDNAIKIAKDPSIPGHHKMKKWMQDKAVIDKAYEKTPYVTYVQNDQPYFTTM